MHLRTRCVRACLAVTTIALLGVAAAFAASPVGGATYKGKAGQHFVKAADVQESFTVSRSGKSIVKWSFNTVGTCSWGVRRDFYDNNAGEHAIPVDHKGRFSATHQMAGSVVGRNGTITVHYAGHFSNRDTAPTTVTITFRQGGAGQPVGGSCTTKASFTAKTTPSLGSSGGSGS